MNEEFLTISRADYLKAMRSMFAHGIMYEVHSEQGDLMRKHVTAPEPLTQKEEKYFQYALEAQSK